MGKPSVLIILDGRGITQDPCVSAIAQAQTPVFDALRSRYPHTELITHGQAVGLPDGQMGNSEVGHTHLGAGRVLYQDLVKISRACIDGGLEQHELLQEAIERTRSDGSRIHLFGLCSDGGVHSHLDHWLGMIEILKKYDIPVVLHLISDGRDTDPNSFLTYYEQIKEHIAGTTISLGTIIGRYWAMDRDQRRERIKRAYDAYTQCIGKNIVSTGVTAEIQQQYTHGTTDEFLEPIVIDGYTSITAGDTAVFCNFRTDRMRQLVAAMTQQAYPEYDMQALDIRTMTMTTYDTHFRDVDVLFPKEPVTNTLGEVLAHAGKTQVRIAETEKYPHVTYFFSGGREEPFVGESRILLPSPDVATYDLQPEMSAHAVTEQTIEHIQKNTPDFICLNFANPDMVGHTGNMQATITAVETVDTCLGRVVDTAKEYGYDLIILADHGNAEHMHNLDGSAYTAHTTNLVPCVYVGEKTDQLRSGGSLVDIAPTLLDSMGLEKSEDMTGLSLFTD